MATGRNETVVLPTWAAEYFSAADGFDIDAATRCFADDVKFTVGNAPTAVGVTAGLELLAPLFSSIDAVSHRFWQFLENGNTSAAVADVTYTRKDGQVVTIPAVTIIERRADGRFTSVQLVFDTEPVFA
jgi:ketosteroid isomerase-like protein